MKRKISILVIVTVILLGLTGCSNKTVNTTEPKKNDTQVQDTTAKVPYAHDDLLVEADWLKDNMNENTVIIDARDEKAYNAGHITGAIHAAWQPFTDMAGKQPGDKGWGTLLEKTKLSEVIAKLGIDESKTVVLYSAAPEGWGEDGRIAWTLRVAGLKNVKILNGGWKTWQAKGYPTSKEVPVPAATKFTIASIDESLNTTTEYINQNLDKIKIIDVRETEEFNGATKYGEKRGGHLPNAINITWTKVFNEDGTFKDQKALEELFTSYGITKDDEIVTYCTKGIRSAHLALVLRMAGYDKAKNYDASFYEWAGNDSLKLEK